MTHTTIPTPPRPTWWRRVLLESGYALSAFPLALAAFVVVVTGIALGLGLLVLLIGVPVLAGTAYLSRGLAHVERNRIRTLLHRPCPTPRYLRARPGSTWLRRAGQPLRDPQSWLDLLWAVVGFATGLCASLVALVWWSAAAGGLTYWFWQRYVTFDEDDNVTLAELIGFGEGRDAESLLLFLIGVASLLTLPFAVRLACAVHASLGAVLLSSRAELQQEMTRIETGREAAREAEATSLRRLERDIHDGPQQRLVRLSMDLGRVRRQLDRDPEAARTTLDQAVTQARETVDELRSLSRGIAPPILVDRGLEAAVRELVQRSTVPATVDLDLPETVPAHVETTAYFVASEALTNAAKHSAATAVRLEIGHEDGRLVVAVTDDGTGGAHLAKGHGLAGLEQRVHGVDGTLALSSPDGGPTRIRAELPCG